jgi:hypothetical protein
MEKLFGRLVQTLVWRKEFTYEIVLETFISRVCPHHRHQLDIAMWGDGADFGNFA